MAEEDITSFPPNALYPPYDLTPDEPLLKSTTPGDYHTWRYSHWLTVGEQVYVYFEAARANNTNEIRLMILIDSTGRNA